MKLELVSFNLCPYVQRAAIALAEKGVSYDITYVDLANKPAWFLEMSPFGKVPLLKVDGRVLFESGVIVEYLDEAFAPALHPGDPLDKAEDRAWIEFVNQLGAPGYMLMVQQTGSEVRATVDKARATLTRLEGVVAGPFFRGADFRLIDAIAAPQLQRLWWADQLAGLGIFADLPKVTAWTEALLARESVKASLLPDIHDIYIDYLRGKGSPTRSAPAAWIAQFAD